MHIRTLTWTLVQKARKGGGDKYETQDNGDKQYTYIPQGISRYRTDEPWETLYLSYEVPEELTKED